MRLLFALVAATFAVSSPAVAQIGSPPCTFKVSHGAASPPAVIGPEWFIPLVYVQDQPDSPIEVVAVDFNRTELDVNEISYLIKKRDYILRVRNRSDRLVFKFDVTVRMIPGGHLPESPFSFLTTAGFKPRYGPIKPGETVAIRYHGGSGNGTDPRAAGYRVVVTVGAIEFDDCYYQPSIVLPKALR